MDRYVCNSDSKLVICAYFHVVVLFRANYFTSNDLLLSQTWGCFVLDFLQSYESSLVL